MNMEQIIFWILSLENGRYRQYLKQLHTEFVSADIMDVNGIIALEIDDFEKWGFIQNSDDQKDLLKHVKTLSIYVNNNIL